MNKSKFDLKIILRFETAKSLYEIEQITNLLNIQPSKVIKKGEILSKKPLLKSKSYVWQLETERIRNCDDIDNHIEDFFSKYPSVIENSEYLNDHTTVRFRISVVSDFAQIGFSLNTKSIELLNRLNVPCEFSLFSWGGVI